MNIFILLSAAIQCASGALMSLPSQVLSFWQYGANWREVSHLSEMEKYIAQVEDEYSKFIDHTPFYMFDYLGKIKGIWRVIGSSKQYSVAHLFNRVNAAIWSIGMVFKALISVPVRAIYTAETNLEPDTVKVMIKDPRNELNRVVKRWEKEKDPEQDKAKVIEEVKVDPNV